MGTLLRSQLHGVPGKGSEILRTTPVFQYGFISNPSSTLDPHRSRDEDAGTRPESLTVTPVVTFLPRVLCRRHVLEGHHGPVAHGSLLLHEAVVTDTSPFLDRRRPKVSLCLSFFVSLLSLSSLSRRVDECTSWRHPDPWPATQDVDVLSEMKMSGLGRSGNSLHEQRGNIRIR